MRRGEPKVLSVHSIRNLNNTAVQIHITYRQRLFRTDNVALKTHGEMKGPKQESI